MNGRTVLITGAGSGLGRGLALACASAGAVVVVASPRQNGAETVAMIEERGGTGVWSRCDVSKRTDVELAVAIAVERFGRLDGVVHNATSRRSSEVVALQDVMPEAVEDHVAVSLRGAYHCAVAALPHLRERGGSFVLFTSPAGIEGSVTLPLYGMVKGGLRAFTKSLAREWGPLGVTVNCISPLAMTPAMENAFRENPVLEDRLRELIPLGRIGDSEHDVGPPVVFLLSDAARYITGQTLVVDGGRFTNL